MDRWIDWQKPDFIGRDAAMKERDAGGSGRVLVTLEVDADDADASGFEPVWADGKLAGFITSGGYGHTLGKSLAMAMVDRACAGTRPAADHAHRRGRTWRYGHCGLAVRSARQGDARMSRGKVIPIASNGPAARTVRPATSR
jgi:glycine cleavage system aminomethyltransferase T